MAAFLQTEDDQLGQLMSDPELLRQLVADLPGVDPNSQEVREAVNNATAARDKVNFPEVISEFSNYLKWHCG